MFSFSERTKSASNFENSFFNFTHEEKNDDQTQDANEVTKTFGYVCLNVLNLFDIKKNALAKSVIVFTVYYVYFYYFSYFEVEIVL